MWRSPLNKVFKEVVMKKFAKVIKRNLLQQLEDLNHIRSSFTTNPEKDFTRNRKLDFKETIRILLSMGGQSLKTEIMKYCMGDTNKYTDSAFIQSRGKILPSAMETLFHMFTNTIKQEKHLNNYRLLAIDGTSLNVPFNPTDQETHFPNRENAKGFNLVHINALYDLENRIYVDVSIQHGRKIAESQALVQMVDRSTVTGKVLVVGDRGFENYNAFEHITQKGWDYVIRIKDINSNGIASGLTLPKEDTFDIDYAFEMTRCENKTVKSDPTRYKYIPKKQVFDYLPADSNETYPFKFRILRFPITESTYEVIITSLDRKQFSLEHIKGIYFMRWGIETSFRELKYAIGLIRIHSKKTTFILQEIYARLIMYNFCEAITAKVVIRQSKRKYAYQVNFTYAIATCLQFFRIRRLKSPPNLEALIQMYILPIRPGRSEPRNIKNRKSVSFIYRVA